MQKKALLFFFACCFIMATRPLMAQAPQTNSELANQYFSTGEYDKAVIYYEKFYDQDPFNAYPNYLKCLITVKDFEKAEKLIKKQQKKFSGNVALKLDMGSLYEVQGDSSKAKKVYEDAVKNLTPDLNQINVLGNAFQQRQLYSYATDTYLQGRKLLKGAYPFSFELAECYSQQGKFPEMVNEYISMLEFNPTVLPNIQTILQNKIANDLSGTLTDMVRQTLLRKIQKNPDEINYSELLYWLFVQDKDYESALIQAKALDKRTSNAGDRPLSLGALALSNREYATAEKCFQYVIDKGKSSPNYNVARMQMINSINDRITGSGNYTQQDLQKLNGDYSDALNELGKSEMTAPLIRGYAHLKAFFLHQPEDAIALLQETIDLPNIQNQFKAECKLELADIYVFNDQVWDAALLYGQVDKDFKNDPLGREAKFRNARLSYYLGEFDWAKEQLNVLKEATSQLISNDALSLSLLISDNSNQDTTTDALLMYSRADLLAFQNKDSLAFLVLDSLLNKFPGNSLTDDVWYKKAQLKRTEGKFAEAIPFLTDICTKFPDDVLADDALYQLGDLYESKLNDKEKAKKAYEDLITKYPGSLFSAESRKRFRFLRGDKLN